MKKVFGQLLRYRTLLWYLEFVFLFDENTPIMFYKICLRFYTHRPHKHRI